MRERERERGGTLLFARLPHANLRRGPGGLLALFRRAAAAGRGQQRPGGRGLTWTMRRSVGESVGWDKLSHNQSPGR